MMKLTQPIKKERRNMMDMAVACKH